MIRVVSILADGLLLSTDGSSKLYLIEPDPSAFKPIATAELLKGRIRRSKISNSKLGTAGTCQRQAPDPGSKPVNVCQSCPVNPVGGSRIIRQFKLH